MDPLVNPNATANVDPRVVAQRDRMAQFYPPLFFRFLVTTSL